MRSLHSGFEVADGLLLVDDLARAAADDVPLEIANDAMDLSLGHVGEGRSHGGGRIQHGDQVIRYSASYI